jgi:glycosyltransferase involved in cell wall biosynthesis
MRFYSIIIPVYDRPNEINELLNSLVIQSYKNFEVIVIEDGSTVKADKIIPKFQNQLSIRYFWKENSGQGFTRNFGYEHAKGDYFLVFDSDCIIPPDYLQIVENYLNHNYLDAFGGPDSADSSFTWLQRAINFSMTSIITTGGIRGNKSSLMSFTPRSFNMGISPEVFRKTGGYILPRMGEDIEFSLRIRKNNFKVGLIPEAFVFHKRRTNFLQFFRQLHFFGRGRINIYRFHPESLKIAHFFPAIFVLGIITALLSLFTAPIIAIVSAYFYASYFILIFVLSLIKTSNPVIALLSMPAAFIQLTAYGIGFITEGIRYFFDKRK